MRVVADETEEQAATDEVAERPFGFITFDCYGTLIDWDRGIGDALVSAARDDGVELDREGVLEAYHRVEPDVEDETYRPYREVLGETAVRIARDLGWNLDPDRSGFLAESLPRWPPFPDTCAALTRLRAAGFRMGILSNVDDDLLQGTLEQFPIRFELLVTAQQVKTYKPAPGHFIAAGNRIGDVKWLHAAQSWFHDVEPACEMEIPVAWINRKGESRSGTADPRYEVRTLAELVDRLPGGGELRGGT